MKHQQSIILLRYKHFTKDERNELAILLKKGYSLRDIARVLDRSPASVSREIKRNSVKGCYEPDKAQHKAYVKRLYSKYQGMKIKKNQFVENYIHEKIRFGWSPERISGRLRMETGYSVSFKAVYKYLYHNPFGWPLVKYLKYKGRKKRKRSESKLGGIIKNRVFIDQRPSIINSRLRYGDFEADTMGKLRSSSSETLAVIRERKSRYILAKKVSQLKFTVDGFKDLISSIPIRSLTLDNGPENARYHELNVPTFFCRPYSSWQKGSVENGIGLIRKYIPKKSDLSNFSDNQISAIIERINDIPMKCLDFYTPKEIFEGRYLSKFKGSVLHFGG